MGMPYDSYPWMLIGDKRRIYPVVKTENYTFSLELFDRQAERSIWSQFVYTGYTPWSTMTSPPYRSGPFFKQRFSIQTRELRWHGVFRIFTFELEWEEGNMANPHAKAKLI